MSAFTSHADLRRDKSGERRGVYSRRPSIKALRLLCCTARRTLVKVSSGSWLLVLATCFMNWLGGGLQFYRETVHRHTDWRLCLLLCRHWLHQRNNSTSPASLVKRAWKRQTRERLVITCEYPTNHQSVQLAWIKTCMCVRGGWYRGGGRGGWQWGTG